MTKYEMLSHDDLIRLSRMGDRNAEEYIIESFSPMVIHITRELHLQNNESDIEDYIQEGMIGLFNAIRDYDLDSNASFSTFAHVCISNKIKNALTYANRKKHMPLRNYEHIEYSKDDNQSNDLYVSDNGVNNPERMVMIDEDIKKLYRDIDEKLSAMEKKVVMLYLNGYSHKEIANIIGKSDKSVYNALTRIKLKLKD